MIRVLWFAFQIALVIYAAMWVAERPGTVSIQWLGYDIEAHIGVLLGCGLIILLFALVLNRMLLQVISVPKALKRYREKIEEQKGVQALTLGLSAVAAGDAKLANYQSFRAQKLLPDDQGLTLLLRAQAARLKGDEEQANQAFQKLIENKDTAFLGLRGLLLDAIQNNRTDEAEAIAREALSMHPKQPWLLNMVFELEIRRGHWDAAQQTLKKAIRLKAVMREEGKSDLAALEMQYAQDKGDLSAKEKHYKAALKHDPSFIPAALNLAKFYVDQNKLKQAAAVIKKIWPVAPHPHFVPLWAAALPPKSKKDVKKRIKHYEALVALNPSHIESQIAAAIYMMDERLWGKAEQYLQAAERIEQDVRIYKIWARLEEELDNVNTAHEMLEKAAEAPREKCWVCKETGLVYQEWSPIAEPHGSFNSIIWARPQAAQMSHLSRQSQPENEIMVLPIQT